MPMKTSVLTSPRRLRMPAHARHIPRRGTTPSYRKRRYAVAMLDAAFMSHAILWLIGAMALGAIVTTAGALFAMGRSGYRKD